MAPRHMHAEPNSPEFDLPKRMVGLRGWRVVGWFEGLEHSEEVG